MRKAERKTIQLLTHLEQNVIDDGMWLWAADGHIYLMRAMNEHGKRAMTIKGGVDPDYIIAEFPRINADGGDW